MYQTFQKTGAFRSNLYLASKFQLPVYLFIISTYEKTLVAIYILCLCGVITVLNEPLRSSHENMKSIIEAFGSSNFENTKVAIRNSKNSLCGKIAVKKLRKVWEK